MTRAQSMAVVRIAIGVGALLAPRASARLLGFPAQHDNPTARLMGRLFAVRDVALGALVLRTHDQPQLARYVFQLNAWVDAGDAASMAAAVIGRRGIDRAALGSAAIALTAVAGWTSLARAQPEPPLPAAAAPAAPGGQS